MLYPDPTYDEDTKIFSGPEEIYVPDPKGLGHAYYTQMRRNRNKLAQYHYATGKRETYGNMLSRCINTSIEMRNRGINPGDIISICAGNSMDNYIPFIAGQMTGAVVASLDPTISLVDSVHLLKQVECKMIFVDASSEQLIETAINNAGISCEIIVIGESNKHTTFEEFSRDKDNINEYQPHAVDDLNTTCVILFSSGTTGLAKGISINHYGFFYQAHFFLYSGSCLDIILTYATTYWVSTVILISTQCLFGKARCVVEKFSPKDIWNVFDKARVTCIFMAPTMAIMMLKHGRPDGVNTTNLRDVIVGGGPLSAENNLALRDLLPGSNVHLLYGQSEAAGIATMFRIGDRRDVFATYNKPTSSGRPILGFHYKIVDPETEEPLGPNERGELRYKSHGMMNGYYGRDSSEAFDENGWIRSGDIAYFDEDLCIYIVDRIKEMLKFQGFHVPPAKLEGILNAHPQVFSSVVIGIPNEDDGDHPMGLVILQPGATVTEEELVTFVDDQVDDRNRLRAGVRFLTTFPYTPSGKVKKTLLKNMILSGEI